MKGGKNKMTNKNKLEKKSLWKEIKEDIVIGSLASLLVCPIISNTMGYFHVKHEINRGITPEDKEIFAGIYKDVYKDGNFIEKTCFFGEYLAANQYLNKDKQ